MKPPMRPKVGVLVPADLRKGLPPLGGNLGFLYNLLPRIELPIVVFGFEIDGHGPELPPLGNHVQFAPVGKSRYPSSIPVRLKSLFWYWRHRKRILRSVDVVYVQQLEATLPFLFGERCVPVIYHQHDVQNPATISKFRWGRLFLFRWFFDLALHLVHRRADWIVAVDEFGVEQAQKGGAGHRVTLLRNCVDDNKFRPSCELRSRGRAEFGLSDSDRVILVSARLQTAKRVDLAIRSFAELSAGDLSVRLLVVGQGPEASALRGICSGLGLADRVCFLGQVSHNEMPKIYNLADVLLLTSEKEGSPMVILEALACGIPIVVTPSGGVSELVRDGDNGLVVGSTSPPEIAATVVRCLNRTWDRSALASSVQNWSSTVVGERLVNLFVTVWKDSRRRNVSETVARRAGGGLKEQNAGIKDRVTEA